MVKSKYLWFIFFAIILRTVAIAQQDSGITSLVGEVERLIVDREFGTALGKVNEILKADPSNAEARRLEINLYYLMDNDKEALRLADIALKDHPSDAGILYMRGLVNNTRGRYEKAIEDFNASLQTAPAGLSYKIYLGRGMSYMNLLEYESAMDDLSKSVSLNDTSASAYQTRAMLNYELRDYKAAIDDFKKALDNSAGNSVLFFNLGMSYFRMEELTEACPWFHKSCQLGNENACRMMLMECAREVPDLR